MAEKYKLIYFNARGGAETIRLIFAQAGVEYDDVRIESEEWPKIKPKMPNGQIPVIEINGVTYCQSLAICRYLAKKFGLHGNTPEEELRVDMIVDTVRDMIKPLIAVFSIEDIEKRAEEKRKCEEEHLPTALKNFEKMLIANNGGDGYFVGNEVTWADLQFYNWSTYLTIKAIQLNVEISKVPKLEALNKKVEQLPRIAAYLEKRPETER